MEVKKSPKADLENKKTSNLLVGAILTLAVLFVGFEWSERDKQVTTDTGIQEAVFEEEIIPITEQNNRNKLLVQQFGAEIDRAHSKRGNIREDIKRAFRAAA